MTLALSRPAFAFAGDREIAVRVLSYLIREGHRPLALLASGPEYASHSDRLRELCAEIPADRVFSGTEFLRHSGLEALRGLGLDYIVSVHFPYIVPRAVLEIPRKGSLNLHPAFLPSNRGWHTASWAILEGTPYGATLHFMSEELDSGDIVLRRSMNVSPSDTAQDLYQRVQDLEFEVFQEAWPMLVWGTAPRISQRDLSPITSHKKQDLFDSGVQRIDPDEPVRPRELIDRLRALTTSKWDEAAYFDAGGRRYRIRVTISEDEQTKG